MGILIYTHMFQGNKTQLQITCRQLERDNQTYTYVYTQAPGKVAAANKHRLGLMFQEVWI